MCVNMLIARGLAVGSPTKPLILWSSKIQRWRLWSASQGKPVYVLGPLCSLTLVPLSLDNRFWIVLTYSHILGGSDNNLFHNHMPTGSGMMDAMARMYRIFVNFYGEINTALAGDAINRDGWSGIDEVHTARKKIRKLHLRLKQESQDLEYLLNRRDEREQLTTEDEIAEFNSTSIPLDQKGIDTIGAEIEATKALIQTENAGSEVICSLVTSFNSFYLAAQWSKDCCSLRTTLPGSLVRY
jgi:hypothetical protein